MSNIKKWKHILGGRVARNLYIWLLNILITLYLNSNNSTAFGYDFNSPWYWRVQAAIIVLLVTLTYFNNLVLIPRLLMKQKRNRYFLIISLAIFSTAFLQVLVLKAGKQHFDVNDMQQVGIMSTIVSDSYTVPAILNDMLPYIVGHSIWILLFTAAWYMNDYSRQQHIAEAAQKKQVEMELHFLKNQINPHFLFNTLNNLYGLALKKTDNAPDAILKLSSILRYLLYESNSALISFEKEKEIMQAYIELELLRITDTQGLHFSVSADKDYSIPPLLWLPLLENLFKHGTKIIEDHYSADFKFNIKDNMVYIDATNKYKGVLQINGNGKAGGIGLDNLQKRLNLLYPGKHNIVQQKAEDTYTIHVQIALT